MSTMEYCMLSHFSCVQLFATLWTVACLAALSMGISRQQYWRGWQWPPPGNLPDSGIKPESLAIESCLIGSQVLYHWHHLGSPEMSLLLLLLLLLSHFSHVWLCDPIDGSPPGSPVPGILQQEQWSGLPFPSPMQEMSLLHSKSHKP